MKRYVLVEIDCPEDWHNATAAGLGVLLREQLGTPYDVRTTDVTDLVAQGDEGLWVAQR